MIVEYVLYMGWNALGDVYVGMALLHRLVEVTHVHSVAFVKMAIQFYGSIGQNHYANLWITLHDS